MKQRVLDLIKSYMERPDVQADETTMSVLNCLAGDVQVISEAAAQQWVSVETELPPLQTRVLMWFVTVDPKNSDIVIGERSAYEQGKIWSCGIYRDLSAVTHWMPLPAAPVSRKDR